MEAGRADARPAGAVVKYYTRVGSQEYVVDIENDGTVYLDGTRVDVDLVRSGVDEAHSLLFEGRSYELLIDSSRFDYTITLRGEQYLVQVEDERMRRMNASRTLVLPGGDLAVSAPIPGLVVRVLVEEGQSVQEGHPLLILEAMKMENELRAARSGVVTQIKVAPGQRVEQNAVLLVLE